MITYMKHETDTMPDLETNFAIAIIGMTIFCIVLVELIIVWIKIQDQRSENVFFHSQ